MWFHVREKVSNLEAKLWVSRSMMSNLLCRGRVS